MYFDPMRHATTGVSTLSLLLHLRRHSNIRQCRRGQCPVGVPLGSRDRGNQVCTAVIVIHNVYKGPAGPGGSFLSLGLQRCSNSLRISRTKFNRTLVDCNKTSGARLHPILRIFNQHQTSQTDCFAHPQIDSGISTLSILVAKTQWTPHPTLGNEQLLKTRTRLEWATLLG